MPNTIVKPIRVSFVAAYPPCQCGTAAFSYYLTHHLANRLAQQDGEPLGTCEAVEVIAINQGSRAHDYGPEVRFTIRKQHQLDYREAADYLNQSQTQVVSLQHEFGTLGGEDGAPILDFLGHLMKPVVTTLHTVLKQPSDGERGILRSICARSALVVVLSARAAEFLGDIYEVPKEKIVMIHHGVPDVPSVDPAYYKDQCHAEGHRVIFSFGLLSPNKGIEVAIEALAWVVKEFPDVLYMVVGGTHPEEKRLFGEQYRRSLERLVKRLGLEQHVVFHNRYVGFERLLQFLLAADICLTPYQSKEQVVSGALAYAVGCGKAIISTPYWYAEELLADGRGCLVPFGDPGALAEQLRDLLRNERRRGYLEQYAYRFGRQMIWREVTDRYLDAFYRAIQESDQTPVHPQIWPGVTNLTLSDF